MPTREQIKVTIGNNRQQNRAIEDELIKLLYSIIVTEEDGIYRVLSNSDQKIPENGYLVISSRNGNDPNLDRHLALKVDNNKFWTISAVNGGSELEIGILENGKHRSIISFNENAALSLNEVLKLGAGLGAIEQDGHRKGIPTSGFKGFKEGRLKPSGNWESTNVKIPENTFGKYRLQAWMIQPDHDRYSHLETVFVFYPKKHPIQRIKYQSVNQSQLGQLLLRIEKWWIKKILKREIEIQEGKWIARLDAKIDEKSREILIKSKTVIDSNRALVHYSIERLWEGEDWIEYDSKK